MMSEEREVLEKAIRVWDEKNQLLMLLEEMSDLQKEVLKNVNRGRENLNNIIESVIDVETTLAQLKIIYNIEQDVAKGFSEKIHFLENILKES